MAFKMKGFNPGHGTGGGSAFLKKSSPYKAETNYLDDKKKSWSTKRKNW
jgi:hypothetical protein